MTQISSTVTLRRVTIESNADERTTTFTVLPPAGASLASNRTLLVADRGNEGDPISGSNQFYLPTAGSYLILFNGQFLYPELGDYTQVGRLVTLSDELGDLNNNDKILLLK